MDELGAELANRTALDQNLGTLAENLRIEINLKNIYWVARILDFHPGSSLRKPRHKGSIVSLETTKQYR